MSPAPPVTFTLLKSARVPPSAAAKNDLHALAGFVLRAEKVRGPIDLNLDLTHPRRIQSLNRHFRGVDRSTDVISFQNARPPRLEGDIAINVRQAAGQARMVGHTLRREIRLLWIHGILHLLGYTDYEPKPRRRMFKRQNALLRAWEKRRP